MTRRIKALTILPVLVAAMAASLGLSAGQAQAFPGVYPKLTITKAPQSGFSTVELKGYVAMSRAEAQEIVGQKYTQMSWSILGEDPIFTDFLDGPNVGDVRASSRGLEFSGTRVLATRKLNEDWGQDEVYTTLRIYTLKGTKAGTSNRVVGDFS
jgi:hypothetical protein